MNETRIVLNKAAYNQKDKDHIFSHMFMLNFNFIDVCGCGIYHKTRKERWEGKEVLRKDKEGERLYVTCKWI